MCFSEFQHTAARRRLDEIRPTFEIVDSVSTHSRPKAAGRHRRDSARMRDRFNTQPPEGGWAQSAVNIARHMGFNTQPPEGGWVLNPKRLFL